MCIRDRIDDEEGQENKTKTEKDWPIEVYDGVVWSTWWTVRDIAMEDLSLSNINPNTNVGIPADAKGLIKK